MILRKIFEMAKFNPKTFKSFVLLKLLTLGISDKKTMYPIADRNRWFYADTIFGKFL